MNKTMLSGLAMATVALCGTSAFADDEGWTKGPNFSFDTRAEKTADCSDGEATEVFTYSGSGWGEPNAGSSAIITYTRSGGDPQTLLDSATDEGTFEWTVERGGRYVFTHKSGGAEETAVFVVEGPFTLKVSKSMEQEYHLKCKVFDGEGTEVEGSDAGEHYQYELNGTKCTVVFTATDGYKIAGSKTLEMFGADKTLGTADYPKLLALGEEGYPWEIGEGEADSVVAYLKDGVLHIGGSGAMTDFADAADVPWDGTTFTAVSVGADVTKIGANAWAGMGDAVTINGEAISRRKLLSGGFAGGESPSGAITPAGAESIQIVDGKVYLGVSVQTNGELTAVAEAKGEGWGTVKVENAKVESDGTVTLTVPATAEKGFMSFRSKDATVK